jgi:hypothetical protein
MISYHARHGDPESLNGGRCSHGPVGRFPGMKSSAEFDRPQAGSHNICEIALVGAEGSTWAIASATPCRLPWPCASFPRLRESRDADVTLPRIARSRSKRCLHA